jgi:uncharacterized protein (DUF2384 family)
METGSVAEEEMHNYFNSIKSFTQANDKYIAGWLGLSERTYGNYKRAKTLSLKPQTQVQVLMILSLIKHGQEVFGGLELFIEWLEKENFYFNKKRPMDYMSTSVGLKFIDNRLTAMEYGDNV